MIELNKIYNEDCLEGMKRIPDGSVDCIVTDIPYNECNRADNGLRNLDKDKADIGMFDVAVLTENLCDKTKGSIYMFCGFNQVSTIRQTMSQKRFEYKNCRMGENKSIANEWFGYLAKWSRVMRLWQKEKRDLQPPLYEHRF